MATLKAKDKVTDDMLCAFCKCSDKGLKECTRCRLVRYCSKECQTAHWKATAGHRKFCVPVAERIPQNPSLSSSSQVSSSSSSSGAGRMKKEMCAICLEELNSSSENALPCSHTFHKRCLEDLKCFAESKTCPLCRTDLPSGEEQQFLEACKLYIDYLCSGHQDKRAEKNILRLYNLSQSMQTILVLSQTLGYCITKANLA
jgi:hypothetical protein